MELCSVLRGSLGGWGCWEEVSSPNRCVHVHLSRGARQERVNQEGRFLSPESTSALFLSRPRVRLTSTTLVFLDRSRPKAGKERGRLGQPDLKGPLQGAFLQSGAFVQWLSPTLCDPMDCSMPGVPVHTRAHTHTHTHTHACTHARAQTHPPHHRQEVWREGNWRQEERKASVFSSQYLARPLGQLSFA